MFECINALTNGILPVVPFNNPHPFTSLNTTNCKSNQIRSFVATKVKRTCNTTNTPNKSLSHQFTCNVSCNETAETSMFFYNFIVHTTSPCLASKYFKC